MSNDHVLCTCGFKCGLQLTAHTEAVIRCHGLLAVHSVPHHTAGVPACKQLFSKPETWHTIRAANLQEFSRMKHYSYRMTAADDAFSMHAKGKGDATHPVAKKGGVGLLPSGLCSPRIHKDTSAFIFSRPYCTAGHTASINNTWHKSLESIQCWRYTSHNDWTQAL